MCTHPPLLRTLPPPYVASGPALVFADTETGGRRGGLRLPFLHHGRRIWDFAACRRHPDGSQEWLEAFVALEDLPFDPDDQVQMGLLEQFGRFSRRHPQMSGRNRRGVPVLSEADLAAEIMFLFRETPGLKEGRDPRPVLIGATPGFEDIGIGDLLRRHGLIDSEPPWNYRLWDVRTAGAARLRRGPHASPSEVSRLLGVDPQEFDAHTARGDVEWDMALYDATAQPLWRIWAARAALAYRSRRKRARTPQEGVQAQVAA